MNDDLLRMVWHEGGQHLVLGKTLPLAEAMKSLALSNRTALLHPGRSSSRCWMRVDNVRGWIIYDWFSPELN